MTTTITKMRTNDLIIDTSSSTIIQKQTTTWKQIECAIRENLEQFEEGRKFCAYCGQKEDDFQLNEHNRLILGRCYGCQMVYYCSQEHQNADWLEYHMPKCAELEWVALGELIQSIPANPALTNIGMYWPENYLPHTWTDWFEIRPDLVQIAKQTALILEQNQQVKLILNKFNRREPSNSDLVDGLLAAVTDSITYALTIGNCLNKTGINPNIKPVCIHLLHPPNELIDDLDCLNSSDQLEIDRSIKKKFYELCNMFPLNKGIEIVFITLKQANSLDWTKLLKSPFMKTQLHKSLPLTDKNLYISAWQGSYSNYIKYACEIEGYSHPDLVVSFHPSFTSSPHKLINEWTDDLKIILTNNFPCLFTFYDKEEKQKAFNILNAFQSNFICVQSNQFSSLMLKQMQAKPNHVYASNSFSIVIKGFMNVENDSRYQHQAHLGIINENSSGATAFNTKDNTKRSKNINDLLSFNNQHNILIDTQSMYESNSVFHNDACIQTLGLEEPENASLRHINGKLQINKSSIYSKINSETLIKMSNERYNLPGLDYSAKQQQQQHNYSINYFQQQQKQQIIDDNELKVNYRPSNFLCKNSFSMPNQNYYSSNQQNQFFHSKLLVQPVSNNNTYNNQLQQQQHDLLVCNPSTPMIQTRSRSRPVNHSSPIKTSSIVVIPSITKEETASQPPPLKPRISNNINNTITNVEPVINSNNNDILDLNSIPTTKPRMRPTRIYEKYTNTQPNSNIVESQISQIVSNINPMPKPRNSIHLTDNKLELNLVNDENEQSEQNSNLKSIDDAKLSFKANLLKKSKEQKEEFLHMSTSSSSSSSSPCSSTSALSMSSSPRSHEENTNQINNPTSTSSASSSSSCSQAIMSSSSNSSFNSSSARTNSGFVSQMKNIFESQQQQQQQQQHHIEFKKKQINHERDLNSYEAIQTNTIKKPIPIISKETIEKEDQSTKLEMKEEVKIQTEIENTQTQSEYMNVSNRYLSYLKLKQQQNQETTRFSPPCSPPPLPPLPPSSPPLSRSPSPINSSPFKPTNDKLVSKIISQPLNNTLTTMTTTTTTTTMISSSIINPSSSATPSSRLLSISPVNTPVKVTKSEFRILSNNNINNNSTITNNSDRSASLSGKSMSSLSQSNNNLNFNNRVMLTHIPDSVDVVQFQYEGQRRVVVPGYMTSADILRNMLLNSNSMSDSKNADGVLDSSKAPIIIQRQSTNAMSLKEKLLLQNKNENSEFQSYSKQQYLEPYQQKPPQPPPPTYQLAEPVKQVKIDDDGDLDKKFSRNRSRSMSGIVTLDLTATHTTQIIDIDLDYESKSIPEPQIVQNCEPVGVSSSSSYLRQQSEPIIESYPVANPKPREIKPSIRINQLINNNSNSNLMNGSTKSGNSRRIPSHQQRQSVTGSFDPNDFDSFDEEEVEEVEEEESNNYITKNFNNNNQSNFYDYETKSIPNVYNNNSQSAHIQIESMDKIRESAILQQKIEEDRKKQQMNLVQFDPDDFDSFNEDEDEIELKQEKLPIIELSITQPNVESSHIKAANENNSKQEFLNNRNKLEAMFKKNEIYLDSKEPIQQPLLKEVQPLKIETKIVINDLNKIEPIYNESSEYVSNNNNNNNSKSNNGGGFFRSALDRISSRSSKSKSGNKTRSSSVPLRNLVSSNLELANEIPVEQSTPIVKQAPQPQQRSRINETASHIPKPETNVVANMKTLQLMNKMQSEYDEKQKRRKLRREQKSKETTEKLPPKSPKTSNDRKFLSSIMNTLFSSSNNLNNNDSTSSSNNESKSALQKNEAKRLSLRKLKAKDKAKKRTDGYSDDEMQKQEMKSSNRSLNIIQNSNHYNDDEEEEDEDHVIQPVHFPRSTSFDTGSLSKLTSVQFQPTSIGTASINSRFGKIKNETDKPKDENNKENLMKQLKAELDEEIKDRRMIELKNNIINGGSTGGSTSSGSSDCYNQYDAKSLSLNRKSLKDSNQNRINESETSQNNRKIRSKSVTFLDAISTDDEVVSISNSPQISTQKQNISTQYSTPQPQHRTYNQQHQQQQQQQQYIDETNNTPSSARKTKTNVKTGDVRLMCGALTGVGPIRSIMKKSATDLSLTLNTPSISSKSNSYETNNNSNRLPSIQLNEDYYEENNYDYKQHQNNNSNSKMIKSQTQPNIARRRDLMQSDL